MTIKEIQNLVGKMVNLRDKKTGEIWDARRVLKFEITKTAIMCVMDEEFNIEINIKEFDLMEV